MATWTYKKIRELRDTLTEELRSQVSTLTVDHLMLIEMRIQNILSSGLDEKAVELEKVEFKKS